VILIENICLVMLIKNQTDMARSTKLMILIKNICMIMLIKNICMILIKNRTDGHN